MCVCVRVCLWHGLPIRSLSILIDFFISTSNQIHLQNRMIQFCCLIGSDCLASFSFFCLFVFWVLLFFLFIHAQYSFWHMFVFFRYIILAHDLESINVLWRRRKIENSSQHAHREIRCSYIADVLALTTQWCLCYDATLLYLVY